MRYVSTKSFGEDLKKNIALTDILSVYLIAGKGPVFGQVQLQVGTVLRHKVADRAGLRPNVVDCAHMVP